MKLSRGCDGPPVVDGEPIELQFPPETPRATISMCPVRYLMDRPDVGDMIRMVNLSGSRVSVTEQLGLPAPYLEAMSWTVYEQNEYRAALSAVKR